MAPRTFRAGRLLQPLARLLAIAVWLALSVPGEAMVQPAAQRYLVEVWQTERGLPENIVNAIAQTPDGYLWCGTTHGLARFDGVRFKVFNAKNTPQLGSGRIRQLFVSRDGALWIAVFEGRVVRLKQGTFTAFIPPPRETTARTIIRMAEDKSGVLWLTVEDGAVFRLADGKFSLASKEWSPSRRTVFQVYGDAQGQVWVTTASSLARLEQGKPAPPVLQSTKTSEYEFLCPSRSGGWWIQTTNAPGLQGAGAPHVRLWREGQWIADAGEWLPPERRVEWCLEDRRGSLWVASLGKGIFCYSTNTEARQLTMRDGLGSDLVRALFEDTEGNIWAGTRAGGLNRLRPALFQSFDRKSGLSSDLVTAICQGPGGELWVGTDGEGVDRMQGNTIQHFGKEQGLGGLHVRALLWDHQSQFWVGAWPGGLFKFDRDHFNPKRDFPGRDMGLASLFEDSQGRMWLGQRTTNRVVRFEGEKVTAIALPNPEPSLDVTVLAEDAAGSIWVGTDGSGLFRWKDGQCRRFTRQDGLSSETIRSLQAEPDGSLWIGTLDGGLCRLKNGRFVTCTTRDGLVDDVINYIADDGRGFFWFTSFQGVFRVSKAELNEFANGARRRIECLAFGKSDGLPALECPGGFQPAGCRTRDGRLWFPTIKGLAVVDPANVPTNAMVPPVLIEDVLVDGERLGTQPAGTSTEISAGLLPAGRLSSSLRIRPGNHRYEFHYTGLNYSAPERVRFRHKLEGVEEDWIEADTQRTANYSHLAPGEYRFWVTACNQAGVWNETPAVLSFTVLPYFWQTLWFTVGASTFAALALGGTVFFAVRRRMKRQLERLEMQLSVEKERARIAQDIHDGVGANLTEIAWLAEVAEKDAADPKEVREQARKISSTARETVQSFDEIVWAVLPENDTLVSLVEYLGRRVDELFESTSTRYRFIAPNDLPEIMIPAEVRHSFYLACKEALHNVNKHAKATEVRVQVTVQDGTLRVDVEDNGCGIDPATASRGNGLRNLRKRFADLGGQFELHTSPGQGTKVSMVIPLNHSGRTR